VQAGSDKNGLHANGDSFELRGGLHLTTSGHNPIMAWLPLRWLPKPKAHMICGGATGGGKTTVFPS
jgi:hypothetical protein